MVGSQDSAIPRWWPYCYRWVFTHVALMINTLKAMFNPERPTDAAIICILPAWHPSMCSLSDCVPAPEHLKWSMIALRMNHGNISRPTYIHSHPSTLMCLNLELWRHPARSLVRLQQRSSEAISKPRVREKHIHIQCHGHPLLPGV